MTAPNDGRILNTLKAIQPKPKKVIYMNNATTFPTWVIGNGHAICADVARLNQGGQFFTVVFITKQGKERTMNCRTGVKRYLKGGKSTIDHKANLLSVYDVKAAGYRCINFETIKEIRSNGNRMIFK